MIKMSEKTYTYNGNVDICDDCGRTLGEQESAIVTKFHTKIVEKNHHKIIIDEQLCLGCHNKRQLSGIKELPCWMTT